MLFKLASDLTKMQLACDIDETDIGKVKEGQKVRFTVSAYQGETFNGAVRQVRYSPLTAQNVVTYTTIVNADNPDLKLLPGMTATVSIITDEAKGVLKVPNSAMRFTPTLPQAELQKILARYLRQLSRSKAASPARKPQRQGQRVQGQTSKTRVARGGSAKAASDRPVFSGASEL